MKRMGEIDKLEGKLKPYSTKIVITNTYLDFQIQMCFHKTFMTLAQNHN